MKFWAVVLVLGTLLVACGSNCPNGTVSSGSTCVYPSSYQTGSSPYYQSGYQNGNPYGTTSPYGTSYPYGTGSGSYPYYYGN
jgi:hypothetical protein